MASKPKNDGLSPEEQAALIEATRAIATNVPPPTEPRWPELRPRAPGEEDPVLKVIKDGATEEEVLQQMKLAEQEDIKRRLT
jgi:hypothetical protein